MQEAGSTRAMCCPGGPTDSWCLLLCLLPRVLSLKCLHQLRLTGEPGRSQKDTPWGLRRMGPKGHPTGAERTEAEGHPAGVEGRHRKDTPRGPEGQRRKETPGGRQDGGGRTPHRGRKATSRRTRPYFLTLGSLVFCLNPTYANDRIHF